jgi:hypothetical protein
VRNNRVLEVGNRGGRRRGQRLCANGDCTNPPEGLSPYCPECREERQALSAHTSAGAAARKATPEMQRSLAEVRYQVALMAERDPFYRGGPA